MGRPKQFDRDEALAAGIVVFWEQGFAATTTDDLARAMGIGRQSFYNAFGDKRRCYLECLRSYVGREVGGQVEAIRRSASPLQTLRDLLRAAAAGPTERRELGCMVVNAFAEFGTEDPEVAAALAPSAALLEQALTGLLREGKARGELDPALDEAQAVRALLCTRSGLMLSAKAGWPPESLRQVADFTVDRLAVATP